MLGAARSGAGQSIANKEDLIEGGRYGCRRRSVHRNGRGRRARQWVGIDEHANQRPARSAIAADVVVG